MPVPYSDNLYSALEDDDDAAADEFNVNPLSQNETSTVDEDEVFSPADGYFHASDDTPYPRRQSSNVPNVPNVLVEDPSLRQRQQDVDAKTREAEQENRLNTLARNQGSAQSPASPPSSRPQPFQPAPLSTSSSFHHHHHRRSVEEDEPIQFSPTHFSPAHSSPEPVASPRVNEQSPLFQQQPVDAPPAYTPASPTQHNSPGLASPVGGYQTFGPLPSTNAVMGVPEEHQRLLPHREPESMGGEAPGRPPPSMWERVKNAFTITNLRGKLKRILGILLAVSIFLMIFGSFTLYPDHSSDKPPHKTPIDNDNPSGSPSTPTPFDPLDPDTGTGDLRWQPRKYCRQPPIFNRVVATYGTQLGENKLLSINQFISRERIHSSERQPRVEGVVVLRPAGEHTPAEGELSVEVLTNEKFVPTWIHFDYESQDLNVTTPRAVEWQHASAPCIQMRITLWLPKDAVLDTMIVNTTQLDIDIVKGLDLGVESRVLLKSLSGNINAPTTDMRKKEEPYALSKRETVIETTSGDVKGWFALRDLLKVTTISGDVTLGVSPSTVDSDKPVPARLELKSASGDISVHEPIDLALAAKKPDAEFPPREYVVDVETISGAIGGDVAITSHGGFKSASGNIDLRLWPVVDPKQGSVQTRLETDTKSGGTTVNLLEPLWTGIEGLTKDHRLGAPEHHRERHNGENSPLTGDKPWIIIHPHTSDDEIESIPLESESITTSSAVSLRDWGTLLSSHKSVSGDIKLDYPSSWTGSFRAETISGSQRITGKDVKTYGSDNGFVMRTISGRKGLGSSDLNVNSISGDQKIKIGKE